MTDQTRGLDNPIQGPTSGRALFRLIVQSLLRAGIKSIPVVGSGLDQAFWGTKDAIAKAELKSLVEAILSSVNELRDAIQDPSNEEIARIADFLLRQSKLQPTILRLNQANTSTLKTLVQYVRELNSQSRDLETAVTDFRELTASVEAATSTAVEQLRKTRKNAEIESRTIHERLNRISHLLRRNSSLGQPQLEAIVSDLRALETELLSMLAFAVWSAIALPYDRQLFVTVDFSEIHRYATSPHSDDPIGAFAVYDFRACSTPFYLLPGSAFELRAFLNRRLYTFADAERLREKIRARIKQLLIGQQRTYRTVVDLAFLADATLSRHSPLQRLTRLFKEGLVVPWSQPLPSEEDLRERFVVAYQVLSEIRPNVPRANMIDARNLAIVQSLNAAPKRGRSPVTHLSGSPNLINAARTIERAATLEEQHIPTVLHPCALAFAKFLNGVEANFDKEQLVAAARQIQVLPASVRGWTSYVRSLSLEKLGRMAGDIRSVVEALETLHHVVNPFHRSLLDCEVADLIGDEDAKGTTLWEARFEEVHLKVVETIIDLLSYLEPLEQAMAPFLELSIKLPAAANQRLPKS